MNAKPFTAHGQFPQFDRDVYALAYMSVHGESSGNLDTKKYRQMQMAQLVSRCEELTGSREDAATMAFAAVGVAIEDTK